MSNGGTSSGGDDVATDRTLVGGELATDRTVDGIGIASDQTLVGADPASADTAAHGRTLPQVGRLPPAAAPPLFESERYDVVRRLGAGGFGVVYAVRDKERGDRQLALKLLRHLDPEALYRFKQEFRSLADLRHPSLVRLHELHAEGESWFFTMDLV
ncbi:MAG: hypothetical protein KC503_46385, partial [Myxococcales bacterium]|nr:hypothetical protein [Myxococcales bacterium]